MYQFIEAKLNQPCRRCKKALRMGDWIWYAKNQPVYCEDCGREAVPPDQRAEPVGAVQAEGRYGFHRNGHDGTSHAHAGRATPGSTQQPLLQRASEQPADPVPLAAAFREQQLGELLPLLREVRDLLREALHARN